MRTLTDLAAIIALVLLLGFFQERDEADRHEHPRGSKWWHADNV